MTELKDSLNTGRTRISRVGLYFSSAIVASWRSTCNRAKVGCIAVKNNRIIAMGYNGALPDEPHCNSDNCTPLSQCTNSVHAEANLIAFCAKEGIPLSGVTLYCTHQPCKKCAELIIQAGIKEVNYLNSYRDKEGRDLLEDKGIVIYQWNFNIYANYDNPTKL